ncbi:peptidylglycine alpha-hydroxylating monooxygenase isoform X3 [Nasonia vitripennis]|nr:peptidylglycine alpha-hydroxylating monooxygenase isoform X3 [Nasonia vitripennis]XP_032457664.1 peptidylglycine alpha-hydroxylating monooxygenase isoform X3 [Nasonia vitripennis]XP_032457665.1 peptidylglycine alpha-hydroxylating monooxygenase isoform X3 [Nasonia vitripennis]
MDTAHHIILYGCSKPGSSKPLWNCGEMSYSSDTSMTIASPCEDDSEIIYAWARDAPALILPDGVGFKVGKGSLLKYLVLQVHYAHIDQFKDGSTDDSGITLHITKQPLTKLAGVYVLGTGGGIPPNSIENMESSCKISENKTLYPFAYRVHTHSLGKVVSGYIIKNNEWIELGKRDPLTPQMFYNINYNGTITYGDRLAARCTMKSERDKWTYVGTTNNDEMCNFYLMYYVTDDEPLYDKFCFSMGPPRYYWRKDGLINIPDSEASTL